MTPPPRVPLGLRVRFAIRRLRFRLAARLVRGLDGLIVDANAWQAALDRLAAFSEWASSAGVSRRVQESHEANVEDVTRLLVLGAESGDPTLPIQGLQDRYVNIRYRAMSKRKRDRLRYEAALRALEARIGKPDPRKAPDPIDGLLATTAATA